MNTPRVIYVPSRLRGALTETAATIDLRKLGDAIDARLNAITLCMPPWASAIDCGAASAPLPLPAPARHPAPQTLH